MRSWRILSTLEADFCVEALEGIARFGSPEIMDTDQGSQLTSFAWTDRLGETFSDLDLALFPGVGHFPHREDPDRAAAEIAGFFARIGWA